MKDLSWIKKGFDWNKLNSEESTTGSAKKDQELWSEIERG